MVGIPEEVHQELVCGRGFPEEHAIAQGVVDGWLTIRRPTPAEPPLPDLDEGEAACIRLALAHPGPRLLLIDELAGRSIARDHGLQVAGTAAVIGMAKSRGLVESAREVLARLHATDFRISAAVIHAVLRRVGELR